MTTWQQSPTDPAFVQNPYPGYAQALARGSVHEWPDYGMKAVFSHAMVQGILRDRRFGREPIEPVQYPEHLAPFYAVEAHSMLELEPPRHKRLRGLVLRAFTSRRIKELQPEIEALCDDLLAPLPRDAPFDLIERYCAPIPVIIICRLLGVPESMADQLLVWSNAMVAMYQARRDDARERAAAAAAQDFSDFLRGYIDAKRRTPRDDLITHLIAAEEDGESLSTDELISTCILLLNAGHEATVHTIGNGVKTLLESGTPLDALAPDAIERTVEEILRYDPPLHVFTRFCYEEVQMGRTTALPKLFAHMPDLTITEPPRYADLYHFHGLERLMVRA